MQLSKNRWRYLYLREDGKNLLRTWDRGGLAGGGMVGLTGLEPVTPALSRQCSNQLSYRPAYIPIPNRQCRNGGGKRVRTADPLLAKQVLYQLSYTPINRLLDLRLASPWRTRFFEDERLSCALRRPTRAVRECFEL